MVGHDPQTLLEVAPYLIRVAIAEHRLGDKLSHRVSFLGQISKLIEDIVQVLEGSRVNFLLAQPMLYHCHFPRCEALLELETGERNFKHLDFLSKLLQYCCNNCFVFNRVERAR